MATRAGRSWSGSHVPFDPSVHTRWWTTRAGRGPLGQRGPAPELDVVGVGGDGERPVGPRQVDGDRERGRVGRLIGERPGRHDCRWARAPVGSTTGRGLVGAGAQLGCARVGEVGGQVDVPAEVRVLHDAGGQVEPGGLGAVAPERAGAVREARTRRRWAGRARWCRRSAGRARASRPGSRPASRAGWRVAGRRGRRSRGARPPARSAATPSDTAPFRPATRAPHDLGAGALGPRPHLVVVAHHDRGQRIGGQQHDLGHVAGQVGPLPGVERAGQPDLGLIEGLDRHHHGGGGRRSHRAEAYRRRHRATPGDAGPVEPAQVTAARPAERRPGRPPAGRGGAGYGDAMPIRVAVIGAGSWGTTVAALASRNAPTVLWARRPELAAEVAEDHRNSAYLDGLRPARGPGGHLRPRRGAWRGRRAGDGRAVARHALDAARAGAPRAAVGPGASAWPRASRRARTCA